MGSSTSTGEDVEPCVALFGRPVPASGLTDEECQPSCPCLGYEAPVYDEASIAALEARVLLDPPAELAADPYVTPEAYVPEPDKVCAVLSEGSEYRVATFDDEAAAEAGGGQVTHFGGCGLCSSLQDLAVYIRNDDLTAPVRQCALDGITMGEDATLQCLLGLGFTMPCAQAWLHNSNHTRMACLDVCLELLDAPYHNQDGSLNACLQCDEDMSGDVFKAVAGRTRRNTGLASALCRPCDEVRPLLHVYD